MDLIRQINTHFEKDDYEKVVSMMIEDRDFNKAEFVRKLIRQEWERRQAMKVKAEATNGSN